MRIDVLLEPDQTAGQLVELAKLCEQAGISRLWLQNYVSCRDPFMCLVPAAAATSRVGLGVCVVSPWEMHPVKMANALLTLQELSDGRAALVIGGGGEWLARLGIEPVKRVRAVREAVELVRGGLSSARAMNYQGELYRVWGYKPRFGEGQPPPLVYAGANQSQMLRATVPAATASCTATCPRTHATRSGRPSARWSEGRDAAGYRISNIWAWHVKEGREEAAREARREVLLRGLLERWYLESFLSAEDCDLVERNKTAFFKAYRNKDGVIEGVPERVIDALLANLTITGTPADLPERIDELRVFADAGVNEICFRRTTIPRMPSA